MEPLEVCRLNDYLLIHFGAPICKAERDLKSNWVYIHLPLTSDYR